MTYKELYRKERRRIQQFIRRAEKRGYRFDSNVLPKIPKRITKASVHRLIKITPKALYQKATALDPETGKIVTGTERKKQEQKERARKSSETRKARKRLEEEIAKMPTPDFYDDSWVQRRRRQDEKEKKRIRNNEIGWEFILEGQIVYEKVKALIDQPHIDKNVVAKKLDNLLQQQINKYGFNVVMANISNAPQDFLEACEIALKYRTTTDQHQTAIARIAEIITGEIPTAEQMREMSEDTESSEEW